MSATMRYRIATRRETSAERNSPLCIALGTLSWKEAWIESDLAKVPPRQTIMGPPPADWQVSMSIHIRYFKSPGSPLRRLQTRPLVVRRRRRDPLREAEVRHGSESDHAGSGGRPGPRVQRRWRKALAHGAIRSQDRERGARLLPALRVLGGPTPIGLDYRFPCVPHLRSRSVFCPFRSR
jgi:hypothetical protein